MVILDPVPRILLQQGTNLVNKFALLLHKCRFAQDSRDKPENDGSSRCWLSICCEFFNFPSPADKSAASPARGEVLNNITFKGLDVVRQYAALLERRVQSSTRVRKAQAVTRQTNPIGRSMIEMLGVLAIVAVLSVGGIAGYSKAMRMWRSNIQRNMIAEFIAGAIKVKSNLAGQKNKYSNFENITPALAKMGDIPEGVTYSNGNLITKDNMRVIIRYGFQTWTNGGELRYSILFNYKKGNDFSPTISDFCRNLIITAQQAAEEINLIAYWGTDSNKTDNKLSGVQLYNSQNLKQATLSEINNKCQDPFKEAGGATFELLLWPY
mgnify:FL=1